MTLTDYPAEYAADGFNTRVSTIEVEIVNALCLTSEGCADANCRVFTGVLPDSKTIRTGEATEFTFEL